MSADEELLFGEVVEKLRAAARADRSVDATQIYLINLADIIRSAGPHWQKMKDRIRVGSMAFLKGCLGPNDIVIPCGDGFLVVFGQGGDSEGLQRRSRELQDLLIEYYCGEEGLSALRVEAEPRKLDQAALGAMITQDAPAPGKHEIMFTPIWTAKAQLIASYLCQPVRGEGHGRTPGYDAIYREEGRHGARDYLELDLAILKTAAAALKESAAREPAPQIGVSVHASTLHNRAARTAYLEHLRAVALAAARPPFVRLAEIERGAPLLSVSEWTGMLRAHVRQVMLEFHVSDSAIADIDQSGAWGAGYALPQRLAEADLGRLRSQMPMWGARLAHMRLRFQIGNVRGAALLRMATEAGAHYLSGETYWPSLTKPAGVLRAPAPFPPAEKPLP